MPLRILFPVTHICDNEMLFAQYFLDIGLVHCNEFRLSNDSEDGLGLEWRSPIIFDI